MINHELFWTYGTLGNTYTPHIREIHKEKMESLFGFINKIVLGSGQENPVFNCGSMALNVIKECFYINNK